MNEVWFWQTAAPKENLCDDCIFVFQEKVIFTGIYLRIAFWL